MDFMIYIILGVIVIAAIVLVVIGLRAPKDSDTLENRLAEFVATGETK